MVIIFFLFGLIIGSFLNVVVYRLNLAETLMGRSHCPACKSKIRWHDNVPLLSFVLLSAKCRDCGEKISWQYPIVELFTGVIFALVGKYFFILNSPQSWVSALFYFAIFAILIIIFVYDFKFMEIPMHVLWLGVIIAITHLFYLDWNIFPKTFNFTQLNLFSSFIAAFVSFLFFFSLAFYSKETWMGYGDAYVGMLAGLIVGWPAILAALLLAFTVGAIVSLILVLFKGKTMKSQVPFAPFLVIGIMLAMFVSKIFPVLEYLFIY